MSLGTLQGSIARNWNAFKMAKNVPELLDLLQATEQLIAHYGEDVVARDHVLLVNKSFGLRGERRRHYPDFCVDFLTRGEVLGDVVLFLGDLGVFLSAVDVDPRYGLPQECAAGGVREGGCTFWSC